MPITNPFKDLSKKQTYIAVGGFAVIAGVFVYKRHSTTGSWNPFNNSSTASTASNAIDPLTGLPVSEDNTIDPVTGQSYLAEAQQYGSVSAAEASVSAYGQSSATGSGIPVVPASGSGGSNQGSANTVVGGSVYTSDSAWATAAQAGLADIGYSSTDVATALGLYLTGQPVDSTQANLISAAIAEFGAPPEGTFQIITKPASGPASPPATTPTSGGQSKPAVKPAPPTGIASSNVTSTGFDLAWRPSSGATSYPVRVTYQGKLAWSDIVGGPSTKIGGLSPNRTYTVHVAAKNAAGTSSETGGPAVKTKQG